MPDYMDDQDPDQDNVDDPTTAGQPQQTSPWKTAVQGANQGLKGLQQPKGLGQGQSSINQGSAMLGGALGSLMKRYQGANASGSGMDANAGGGQFVGPHMPGTVGPQPDGGGLSGMGANPGGISAPGIGNLAGGVASQIEDTDPIPMANGGMVGRSQSDQMQPSFMRYQPQSQGGNQGRPGMGGPGAGGPNMAQQGAAMPPQGGGQRMPWQPPNMQNGGAQQGFQPQGGMQNQWRAQGGFQGQGGPGGWQPQGQMQLQSQPGGMVPQGPPMGGPQQGPAMGSQPGQNPWQQTMQSKQGYVNPNSGQYQEPAPQAMKDGGMVRPGRYCALADGGAVKPPQAQQNNLQQLEIDQAMQNHAAPAQLARGGVVLSPPEPQQFGGMPGSQMTEPGAAMRRYSPVNPIAPKPTLTPSPEGMAHHLPTKLRVGKRINVKLPRPTMKGQGGISMK